MKSLITSLLLAVSSLTTFAGGTNSLFDSRELSLSLSSGYKFAGNNNINASVGAQYMYFSWLGGDVTVPLYQDKGISVNSVSFGPVVRIGITDRLAVVARGGASYVWSSDSWTGYTSIGPEFKITRGIGLFINGNYSYPNFNDFQKGSFGATAGIRVYLR